MRDLRERGTAPALVHLPAHRHAGPVVSNRRHAACIKALRNWLYWKAIEKRIVAQADGLLFTCEEELRLAATTSHAVPTSSSPQHRPRHSCSVKQCHICQRRLFRGLPQSERTRPSALSFTWSHPKKGVDLPLKAYARCQQASSSPAARNWSSPVPRADASYWNELQALAVSLGLQDQPQALDTTRNSATPPADIHLRLSSGRRMLSGDLKWGAPQSASAFILPSHQENFGIAVVEALASGTPVLISDKVNIWREIAAAEAGFVAPDSEAGSTQLLKQWLALSIDEQTERLESSGQMFRPTL